MSWVNSFEGVLDLLSLVIVCAPDDFPREDFLQDEDQLTLDKAFEELAVGMQFVKDKGLDGDILDRLKENLDEALAAYRKGDDIKGSHLLQDFETMLQKNLSNYK